MAKRSGKRNGGSYNNRRSRGDDRWDDANYAPEAPASGEQDVVDQERQLRDLLVDNSFYVDDPEGLERYIQQAKTDPDFTIGNYIDAVNFEIAGPSDSEQPTDVSNEQHEDVVSEPIEDATPEQINAYAVQVAGKIKDIDQFLAGERARANETNTAYNSLEALERAAQAGIGNLPIVKDSDLVAIYQKAINIGANNSQPARKRVETTPETKKGDEPDPELVAALVEKWGVVQDAVSAARDAQEGGVFPGRKGLLLARQKAFRDAGVTTRDIKLATVSQVYAAAREQINASREASRAALRGSNQASGGKPGSEQKAAGKSPNGKIENRYKEGSYYESSDDELAEKYTSKEDAAKRAQNQIDNNKNEQIAAARKLARVGRTGSYEDKLAAIRGALGGDQREIYKYTKDPESVDKFFEWQAQRLDMLRGKPVETSVSAPDTSGSETEAGEIGETKTNQQLASELADILDGKLTVDAADKVRYGIGTHALGRNGLVQNSGGRFVSPEQLQVIAANADLIRNNLPNAEGEAEPAVPEGAEPITEPGAAASDTGAEDEPATSPDSPTAEPPIEPTREPTPEPTPPEPEAPERRPLVLSFVDETHDALAAARDAAEARLRNEVQAEPEGGNRFTRGFKRFIRNIWKGEHGLARAYYREKYKQEALEQIQQQNDVLAHETGDMDARTRAQLATIDRFQSEYDESIHNEAGEQRKEVAHNTEFARRTKELIARYVSGEITDAGALEEERGRMLQELQDRGNEQLIGEGKVRIDNLLAIADQVKAMVDHGESIERVLEGMKIYSGEARSNVRTEAHITKAEQIIDKLQRRTVLGGLIGPVGLGAAVAGVMGVFSLGRGTIARATAVTGIPGVVTGGLAGYREWTRLKEERALHSREMAQGKRYNEGDKRRTQMEATRYETKQASAVTSQLNELLRGEGEPGADAVQAAYHAIAKIEANISRSDKEKIDFLEFSDVASVEQERRDLDVARATAKVRLKSNLAKLPAEFRTKFGIDESKPINASLAAYMAEMDKDITSEVTAKDKVYNKLRNRRVATAVAIGAVGGFTAGLAAQEIVASVNSNYDGLIEHMIHGGAPSADGRQTVLEGWFHGQPGEHITASDKYVPHSIGANKNNIDLPDNYKVVNNPDGSFGIEAPNGTKVADNLELNKSGKLTKDSLAILTDKKIEMHQNMVDSGKTEKVSVKEYLKLHKDDVTHVKRDFWYDQNTPKPKFDKNELGLDWGGKDHTGVGKNGSIKMTISGMTADGSYHGDKNAAWNSLAKKGDMALAVSATRGTQTDVFLIKVKPNGSINIPEDRPARKFFSIKNGHAVFKGAFAEAVEVRETKDGTTHIAPLATITGENSVKSIDQTVKVPHIKLTPPEINTPGREVEGFGVPVWTHRRPLERIKREAMGNGYGYGYGSAYSFERNFAEKWLTERSPSLNSNPDVDLNTGKELKWYKNQQIKIRGESYIKELDGYIDNSKELQSIGNETKAIVCIPVAAANESENIYRTLSMFGRQDIESQKASVIFLNVNWKQSLENDPAEKAKIQKTLAEIERARQDFPDLRIATFEKVWSDQFVKEKQGKIYGEVIKVLYDTAAFAMERSIAEGRRDSSAEALLITNDADTEGMSYKYLKNYIKSMEENPKQDTFTATIRRGVSAYEDYPGYAMVSNFYANTSMAMLHHQAKGDGGVSTDGPNSAFRMSLYAAMGGVEAEIGGGADGALAQRAWIARFSPGKQTIWRKIQGKKEAAGSNRVLGKFVSGASVDTMPDRLLGAYRQGKWVASGWDGFDNGGYESREAVAQAGTIGPENPETEIDDIAKRIEISISAFGSRWWRKPSAIATSLRTTFGPNKPGHELYRYTWDFSKSSDGAFVFEFTDEGKKELQKRMLYDRKGNRSNIGARMRHHLYDKLKSDREPVLLS